MNSENQLNDELVKDDEFEFKNQNTDDNVDDELDELEFVNQDDTKVTTSDDVLKYTNVDTLDEDKSIPNQKWVLMSFISPEGIMNCKIRGVKVRGVFATEDEAKAACEKLKKTDKYFDVFMGEMGKWLPWDPTTKQVSEVKFRNKKLSKLMEKTHKMEIENMSKLNELVGRRKEMLDKDTVEHKSRIKNSIKESIANMEDNKTKNLNEDKEEKEEQPKFKSTHNPNDVRDRLRKQILAREGKKDGTQKNLNSVKEKETKLDANKKLLGEETERITENDEKLAAIKSASDNLSEKIEKMKEYKRKLLEEKNKVK